jgi:hypothetical protein
MPARTVQAGGERVRLLDTEHAKKVKAGVGHVSRDECRAVRRCRRAYCRLLVGDAVQAVAEESRVEPKNFREGRDTSVHCTYLRRFSNA